MRTEAEVIKTDGKFATVRVKRSSMCDGCEGSCSAAALMGAGKTVDARAYNAAGASVGDIVIAESSDGKILSYAAIVFLLPLIICAAAYIIADSFSANEKISIIVAFAAFVFTFFVIGIFERRGRNRHPDIVIREIIGQKQ